MNNYQFDSAGIIPFDMSDHHIIYGTILKEEIDNSKIKFIGRSTKKFDADSLLSTLTNMGWDDFLKKIQIYCGITM